MHHAHQSRAAGFSVYNAAAVAIAAARQKHPAAKVLYVDIDAHHGDGVQEAFAGSAGVLTISIHESGLYAFPGTGFPGEIGYGAGEGFSANVPLLNGTNVFSRTNRFTGVTIATNANNQFAGIFSGDGSGLTNLNANAVSNGLTTNIAVLTPDGGTNVLVFTNGILRAVQ